MFNKYPYTDFHELNLDWFLKQFKGLVADWDAFRADLTAQWEQVSADWQTLYNYVHDYFDNLDVQDEIDNKLDRMLADGTLESIIRNALKVNQRTIALLKKGRFLVDRYTDPTADPYAGQAIFYHENYYYAFGQMGGSNVCYLQKWSDNGIRTIATSSADIGHGNGAAIFNNIIYVASSNASFARVDTNLNYLNDIDVSTFLSNAIGVGADDNAVYFYGRAVNDNDTLRIVRYTPDDGLTLQCDFAKPANAVIQGFCVYNGNAYALFNRSNQIYEIDMHNGEVIGVYDVPDGDGEWPTGECENLFIKDGQIYLYTSLYMDTTIIQGTNRYYSAVGLIFETNIINYVEGDLNYNYMPVQTPIVVEYNGSAAYTFNPHFTVTLDIEASSLINYHKAGMLSLRNAQSGAILQIIGAKCSIFGVGGNRLVEQIECINSDVTIYQVFPVKLGIRDSQFRTNSLISGTTTWINIERSDVILKNVDFSNLTYCNQMGSNISIIGLAANKNIPNVFSNSTTFTNVGSSLYLEGWVLNHAGILNTMKLLSAGVATLEFIFENKIVSTICRMTEISGAFQHTIADPSGDWSSIGVNSTGLFSAVDSNTQTEAAISVACKVILRLTNTP